MANIKAEIHTPTIQAELYRATIIPDGYYKIEGTKTITENGTHNVGDYEFADVKIPERKEEQKATVNITTNGTTEIFPDENKVLSKATVNVNVPTSALKISQVENMLILR